jgi:CheY-like chemotaxis protein
VSEEGAATRVLVVSHEEELRVLLRRALRGVGYDAAVASGEAEALARIEGGDAGRLVVLDLAMPRRGGWTVFTRLRALADSPPVVVLVPRGDYRGFAEAVREGAAACVRRPFHPDDLVATCQAVLEGAGSRPATDERRLNARRPVAAEVDVLAMDGAPLGRAQLADLGLGGAQVRMPDPLATGTHLRLVLPVLMGAALTVEAAVQWTGRARGGFAHGLRFVNLTLALRRQIDDLVSASEV